MGTARSLPSTLGVLAGRCWSRSSWPLRGSLAADRARAHPDRTRRGRPLTGHALPGDREQSEVGAALEHGSRIGQSDLEQGAT